MQPTEQQNAIKMGWVQRKTRQRQFSTTDGYKWLKHSAEAANSQYPHVLHELALLYEKEFDSIVFPDTKYAIHLYIEAAMLGYPSLLPPAYRFSE
ncbi:hypothetical protein G6F56_013203 [Rhizopus delemar]|nr:hypothetical protein G6F56_013203 [Rhizopus delemar]